MLFSFRKPSKYSTYFAIAALVFYFIYIFLWNYKLFFRPVVFFSIALALSAIAIFLSGKIKITFPSLFLALIVLYSAFGLIFCHTKDAFIYTASLVMCLFAFIFFSSYTLDYGPFLNVIKYFSVLIVLSVFLNVVAPGFVSRINKLILLDYDFYEAALSTRVYFGFCSYNVIVGLSSAVVCAFTFFELFTKWNRKDILSILRKVIWMAFGVVAIFATIISSKRNASLILAFLSVLFIIIFGVIYAKKHRKFVFSGLLITLIVVVTCFLLFTSSGQMFVTRFINGFKSGDISTGRFERANVASNAIGLMAIIGKGPASSLLLYSDGLHNSFIQIIYEHGVIGFILFAMFFMYNLNFAIDRVLNRNNRFVNKIPFLSLFFQLFYLIYAFTGNPINDTYILLLLIVFSSLLYTPSYDEKACEIKKIKDVLKKDDKTISWDVDVPSSN